MTNFDRAAHLIMEAARESELPTETAVNAVEALAQAGLIAPDGMTWQEADYRPPRFYTLDETTEKGPNLGDHVTRAKRLVGPWEKA